MEPVSKQSLDAKIRRTELVISRTLRLGVALSLATIACGLCITFVRHPDYALSHLALPRLTHIGATFPHTLSGLAFGLKALRGQSFVVLGLLLLIATPVVRVAVSIVAFAQQRDRIFVVITSTVLALLLFSFYLGHAAE